MKSSSVPSLGRRAFLSTAAALAGAVVTRAMPARLDEPVVPVGFIPFGARRSACDAALVKPGSIIRRAARVTVSGHHLETRIREASLDVLFGRNGEYPFHAWHGNEATGLPNGSVARFTVPFDHTKGLRLKLRVDGTAHDLVIDDAWLGPRLRHGHYVIVVDPEARVPNWGRVVARRQSSVDAQLCERRGPKLVPMDVAHLLITVERA